MSSIKSRVILLTLISILGVGVFVTPAKGFYSFDFGKYQQSDVSSIVQQDLNNQEGDYAIYLQDLGNSGLTYTYDGDKQFPSASLYKLVLVAAAYQAVQDNKLSLDEQLTSSKDHLDAVIGDQSSTYPSSPSIISYSVEEAIESTLIESNNYSAVMLSERLRQGMLNDPLELEAQGLGLKDTHFDGDTPVTTANDIGRYFNLLYHRQLISPEISDKLLNTLKNVQTADKLPAELPQGTLIAHKTGELDYVRHDGGIILSGSEPYILVVLSQNFDNPDDDNGVIANLSRDIYNYFQR